MRDDRQQIVFAGGGTGGHLYPGLAVAAELAKSRHDVRITFAGSGRDWERNEVRSAGFDYQAIPCRPVPARIWHNVRFLAENAAGYLAARWLLRERRASLVIGLGGYVSAPTVRAAISTGIPSVLLEQNAVPGRVTQWLAPLATRICVAFPQAQAHLPVADTTVVTGNPIRRQIVAASNASRFPGGGRKRLLILGGSGGARPLNAFAPPALRRLSECLDGWRIVHQTGAGQVDETGQLYQKLGLDALVVSFIDNLPQVLRETDLVVCRGGAMTLAELAVVGLPALVVPFGEAIGNHQLENARLYAEAGGCRVVEEESPRAPLDERLAKDLRPLLMDDAERTARSAAMRHLGRPDATDRVVEVLAPFLTKPALSRVA